MGFQARFKHTYLFAYRSFVIIMKLTSLIGVQNNNVCISSDLCQL